MKRRKLPPDNRLDWRDPNMPAFEAGFRSPEEITRLAEKRLMFSSTMMANRHFLSWKDDPSYNWAEQKKSKLILK